MNNEELKRFERRQFARLEYVVPLACKVCNKDTIACLLQGYLSNLSQAGLCCKISEKVNKDDILWLSFDRSTLIICQELERNSLIYQNGIIGRVVRVDSQDDGSSRVGVQFITRQENE